MEFMKLYLPDRIQWEQETLTETHGRLAITPLERGFGRTLGNAMRRVMLSSLEGAAPVSVTIKGASHEFSALPGIRQDASDIVLNVKSLSIRHTGEEPGVLSLKEDRPGVYTAASLKGDSFLSVANPEQEIAEITGKGVLDLTITVEKGKGFVTVDEWFNSGRGQEIGTILVDSWFCPVRKVNYTVESARVGDRTDYDCLYLDIDTDGSLTPQEAVQKTCDILIQHFRMIMEGESAQETPEETTSAPVSSDTGKISASWDSVPLDDEDFQLDKKYVNILKSAGFETIGGLIAMTASQLKAFNGVGDKTLQVINEKLELKGLKLRTE
jgi:DNA-directed RNA polymerase subunit alpha